MSKYQSIRSGSNLLWVGICAVGFVGGCGSWSHGPSDPEEASKAIREYRKGTHQALKEEAKRAREDLRKQSAMRKGAHRGGPSGR
jgi:hypothetical protein